MKLKKKTWILLAIALSLGSFVYFFEIAGQQEHELLEAKQKKLFNFSQEEIKTLTIQTQKKTLKFERTDQAEQKWRMKQPEDVNAEDASVMFLVNLLVSGQSNRTFTVASKQKSDYGLAQPLATITIQLQNQQLYKLILGNNNFDKNLVYAQVNPDQEVGEKITVILLPITFQYATERDLKEWKKQN